MKGQQERFVFVLAVLFIVGGGYLGNDSGLSTNALLGAILAAVFIMGWIVSSTISGCTQSIRMAIGDQSGKRKDTF